MEKYIIYCAVAIAMTMFSRLSKHWFDKRGKSKLFNENVSNVIRMPKFYLYVGIGGIVIFLAIALFSLLAPESMIANYEDGERLPIFFIFLVICVPYILFIILRVNWRVEIAQSEFNFINIWGIKRTYHYDEVEVKQLSNCTRFYHNGKKILSISPLYDENWESLQKSIMTFKKKSKKPKKL